MNTSVSGTGPYIIFRNYGTEGWCPWARYETVTEMVTAIMDGGFSEQIMLVREVELIEKMPPVKEEEENG